MNMTSDLHMLLEDKTLGVALSASSALMKVLIESLSLRDARTIFCEDADSQRLLDALTDQIQRTSGRSVLCIPPNQRDEIVKSLDSAVTLTTRKASGFNASRAQRNLARLRRVKVDLA
jgi:hypothetical protein